jgi:glycerate kinase
MQNLLNGIDHFLEITRFDNALKDADLLITGEGSIDLQTLEGKAPYGVAVAAKKYKFPVIAFAGKVPLITNEKLNQYFDVLLLPIKQRSNGSFNSYAIHL